jgi:RHS repeat-associated protein
MFNAKEKDEESGLYYYEARYYSDENIMFTARDPMFEKYFWMSPYAYCANNPVIYIDPTGMDLDVPEGESRKDVASIVQRENRDYIKYNGNAMYLDFGEMSQDDIDKTLANDDGLNLLNNMINAKNADGSAQKYLYETTDDRTFVIDGITYTRNVGKPVGTVTTNDHSFATNLSKTPHGTPDQVHALPETGYDGTVRVSKGTMFANYSTDERISDMMEFRRDLIYHELNENYLRTNQGMNYDDAHRQAGGSGEYSKFIWGK